MSKLQDVIRERGVTKLAADLGLSTMRVFNWGKRGVPVEWCAEFERATNGAVTRRDLRPDDWRLIWPELAAPAPPASADAISRPKAEA